MGAFKSINQVSSSYPQWALLTPKWAELTTSSPDCENNPKHNPPRLKQCLSGNRILRRKGHH